MADGTGQLAITNMALEELTTQLKDRRPPKVFFIGARWCSCYNKKQTKRKTRKGRRR
jgi:hypothetical protein